MQQVMDGKRIFRGNENALTDEQKVLIVNGWALLDRTTERASKVRGMDMTWRFQLRSDSKALEKALREMEKSPTQKNYEKLQRAFTVLRTSAQHILSASDE